MPKFGHAPKGQSNMGGRGSISASAESRSSGIKAQLQEIADQINSKKTANAGQRDLATIARTAANLAGTSKLRELRTDYSVTVLAKELGGVGGFGCLHSLNNLAAGANKPLGMNTDKWHSLRERQKKLNGAGFTNEEIAAVIRFDTWLKETV